jgi:hypothetical protein
MDQFISMEKDAHYHKGQFMHSIVQCPDDNFIYFVDGVESGIYRAGFAGYSAKHEGNRYVKFFNVQESLTFVEMIDYK